MSGPDLKYAGYTLRRVLHRGVWYFAKTAAEKAYNRLFRYYYYRAFRQGARFSFRGRELEYFYHPYNETFVNERAIEVPLVRELMARRPGARTLEVGDVLSHYFTPAHEVLDKFTDKPGVIAEDIITFAPAEKYDLVVSISTIEHVGWDDEPREPANVRRAVDNLKAILKPGGRLALTTHLNYNEELDRLLAEDKGTFTELVCYKRVSFDEWKEASFDEIRACGYDSPYPRANCLVLAIYDKP